MIYILTSYKDEKTLLRVTIVLPYYGGTTQIFRVLNLL